MLSFIGLSWCTTLIDGLDMVNQVLVLAPRYGGLAIICWPHAILIRRRSVIQLPSRAITAGWQGAKVFRGS